MDVQVEKTSPTQRKLSVTVPAARVDAAFDKAYREINRRAKIPGFRPGKIPRGLLKMHYGEQVQREVQNELVSSTLAQAMHDSDISPVNMPQIEPGSLAQGAEFSFVAEVEVQPDIEMQQYRGLYVEQVGVEVLDDEIDEDLKSLQKQSSQLVPVMIRDVIEEGDVVQMDYEAFIGGSPVQGSKAENAMIEVGGEGYLPGFSEGLVGAKVPSERQLPVQFPDDYNVKDLAGKEATFHIKVKEIKRKELPALDDEFAKDLGADSLAALTERVRGSIQLRKEREAKAEQRKRVMKALVEVNPFDLPPSLVKAQSEQMIAGAAMRVQQMMGQKLELSEDDLAKLREDNEADAEFQVRAGMLLLEVAKKEGIEVTPQELEAEMQKMAEQSGSDLQRVKAQFATPEQQSQLNYRLLEDKTLEFLLEQAVDSPEAAAEARSAQPSPKASVKSDDTDVASSSVPDDEKASAKPAPKGSGEAGAKTGKKAATKKKTTTKKTAKTTTKKTAKKTAKKTTKKAGGKKTSKKTGTKKTGKSGRSAKAKKDS